MDELIVGIDLGTTNSEIAAYIDGKPQIIGEGEKLMLPSCVGLSPAGELLIGEAARNQMLLYPERTIRSVKRLMGSDEKIKLGDREFSPAEISALILRELARWAELRLGQKVSKAVITVPAYFSDAQRNATRQAGELAGLEVVRIVNEPTAASLAYGMDTQSNKTVMIFDLGGGTFDVSVVRIEGEITEVLASHGNNHLGGDDFDQKLLEFLLDEFQEQHGVDLRDKPASRARLWWAAEAAKKQLSFEPFARIREESLAIVNGEPFHLDIEITREEYEDMIRPLVNETLESVSRALSDAKIAAADLDAVLLVGGSTRTPLVVKLLEDMCGEPPRQDLHPDLCVALGAGVLASRLAGHAVERVLVDVSPFSFGISYLGERNGMEYSHCYRPVIRRNTPLPVTRTEEYFTAQDYQTEVEFEVFQGDDPDAMRNVPVGKFRVQGLKSVGGPNTVLCRMRLDLDGILHVTAIEKDTGLSKHVAISGATRKRDAVELRRSRAQLDELFNNRLGNALQDIAPIAPDVLIPTPDANAYVPIATAVAPPTLSKAAAEAGVLTERCRQLIPSLHVEDQREAEELIEDLQASIAAGDLESLADANKAMSEFLFFVEGK